MSSIKLKRIPNNLNFLTEKFISLLRKGARAEVGFSIGSGDQVAAILAKELGATDLIFATDVDGVYDSDLKKNLNARLIPEVNLSRARCIANVMIAKLSYARAKKNTFLCVNFTNISYWMRIRINPIFFF